MDFLKAQIRELYSNYGDIHGIWWDMNVPRHYDPTVNSMIRKLQPNAIINNQGFDEDDFSTPERDYESNEKVQVYKGATEACQSLDSLSWGYNKAAEYYSDRYLLSSIDRDFAANANYLLNVGPTSEGLIATEASAILKRIGKWYHSGIESFEKVQPVTSLLKENLVSITRRDQTFYIHFNKEISADGFSLQPINVLPKKVTLLNDGREVKCVLTAIAGDYPDEKKYLRLQNLPVNELSNTVLIVKLDFDEKLM
ncbi:MAG: alpha-L-fucosidase [Ginsengibacter sp.]